MGDDHCSPFAGHEVQGESVLWRYMDIPGLLQWLKSGELFFRYPDQFADPFEGQLSLPARDQIVSIDPKGTGLRRAIASSSELQTAVNCWHEHQRENALMWETYGKATGVAVQSTCESLRSALPARALLMKVKYIDYENEPMPIDNTVAPLLYKRKEFEHEQEVRTIAICAELELDGVRHTKHETGISIAVDPTAVVQKVVLHPDLSWFAETMNTVVSGLCAGVLVEPSKLSAHPHRLFKRDIITALTALEDVGKVKVPRLIFVKVEEGK